MELLWIFGRVIGIIGYFVCLCDFVNTAKKVVRRKWLDRIVFLLTYGSAVVIYSILVIRIVLGFVS